MIIIAGACCVMQRASFFVLPSTINSDAAELFSRIITLLSSDEIFLYTERSLLAQHRHRNRGRTHQFSDLSGRMPRQPSGHRLAGQGHEAPRGYRAPRRHTLRVQVHIVSRPVGACFGPNRRKLNISVLWAWFLCFRHKFGQITAFLKLLFVFLLGNC